MAEVELIMPKMGESIMEATILNWLKQEGDTVEEDEPVLEIATDKVDSEVPSPVAGKITKIMYQPDDVVEVGKPIAMIAVEGEAGGEEAPAQSGGAGETGNGQEQAPEPTPAPAATSPQPSPQPAAPVATNGHSNGSRFYSPLVLNIARKENIPMQELETVPGSGKEGRVTKKDILQYVKTRSDQPAAPTAAPPQEAPAQPQPQAQPAAKAAPAEKPAAPAYKEGDNVEIIEMDRMRKMIADHMVNSKHTSPHVTSFVEADVTNLVNWRNKVKKQFQEQNDTKLTFTPLFIEAIVKAIKEYPLVNSSVDGYTIIRKKDVNIGMATALPSGNLIVPVIKNADELNLTGMAKRVNDLAGRARENKLKPEEISGGTFTLTNVGTFGNLAGTPVINQPQVAILATGAIVKKPAVLETPEGDVIAIRHMMMISMSYDHRIVDGALGGAFIRRFADILEEFDPNRSL